MRIISFVANILAISVATFGATMIAQIFISRGLYYFFDGLPLDAKFIWLRYDAMCTVLAMCFTLACHRRRPMAMREHCTCTMIGKVGIFLTLNMASPYTNGLLLADWKIAFMVQQIIPVCAGGMVAGFLFYARHMTAPTPKRKKTS
jgi:hypothetical protein